MKYFIWQRSIHALAVRGVVQNKELINSSARKVAKSLGFSCVVEDCIRTVNA